MKILYGVQGTGNGHLSRARMLARHFQKRNADVTYLISGRERERLFDMACFGDFQHRRGLTFAVVNGKINYLKTITHNNIFTFFSDVGKLDTSAYDVVITDFEPVTARAGKRRKSTVLGIGHQYAFNHKIPVAGSNPLARAIMRHFAPASIGIGLHWHHFGTKALPPIVDPALTPTPCKNAPVVVYLPFEDQANVTQLLQQFPDRLFLQYSPQLTDEDRDHIGLRKTCHDGFKRDLASSQGVICNAGFELVSESLQLGIPVLIKPLKGQMEQLSNAAALRQLGWGATMRDLSEPAIRQWLEGDKPSAPVRYPDVAEALVDWVLSGDWAEIDHLHRRLWADAIPSTAVTN